MDSKDMIFGGFLGICVIGIIGFIGAGLYQERKDAEKRIEAQIVKYLQETGKCPYEIDPKTGKVVKHIVLE